MNIIPLATGEDGPDGVFEPRLPLQALLTPRAQPLLAWAEAAFGREALAGAYLTRHPTRGIWRLVTPAHGWVGEAYPSEDLAHTLAEAGSVCHACRGYGEVGGRPCLWCQGAGTPPPQPVRCACRLWRWRGHGCTHRVIVGYLGLS